MVGIGSVLCRIQIFPESIFPHFKKIDPVNFINMSETHGQGVQLYIGASGKPVAVEQDPSNIYKDYIVKQNLVLQEENKSLAESARQLSEQVEELEQETSTIEKQAIQLKQYVRNFYNVSEIHQEVVEADTRYFRKVFKERDQQQLVSSVKWNIDQSYVFISMMLINVALNIWSPFYGFTMWCIMLGYFITSIQPKLKPNQCVSVNVTELQKLMDLRKSKQGILKDLENTMDIIGKFIDDAL